MKDNLSDILESIDTVNNYTLDDSVINILKLCREYIIDLSDENDTLKSEIDMICDQAKVNPAQLPTVLRLYYPERFSYKKPN